MGALYMALLKALTYECWIPFKTTHFGCALELLERHRFQANEPPLHLRRQKLSIRYLGTEHNRFGQKTDEIAKFII